MNIFARLVLNLKLHIDLYIHVFKYVLYQQNIGIYRYSNIYEIINNRKLKRRWIPKVKNNVHIPVFSHLPQKNQYQYFRIDSFMTNIKFIHVLCVVLET